MNGWYLLHFIGRDRCFFPFYIAKFLNFIKFYRIHRIALSFLISIDLALGILLRLGLKPFSNTSSSKNNCKSGLS